MKNEIEKLARTTLQDETGEMIQDTNRGGISEQRH